MVRVLCSLNMKSESAIAKTVNTPFVEHNAPFHVFNFPVWLSFVMSVASVPLRLCDVDRCILFIACKPLPGKKCFMYYIIACTANDHVTRCCI